MTVPNEPNSSLYYFSSLLETIEANGVSRDRFYDHAKISNELFGKNKTRINIRELVNWFHVAEKLTGDHALALHVGERVHPSNYGALGQLMMSSPNIGEAIRLGIRYERILGEMSDTRLQIHGSKASYRVEWFGNLAPSLVRPLAEQDFSAFMNFAFFLVDSKYHHRIRPERISFKHAPPADLSEYQRIFKCPIAFSAEYNELIFDSSLLEIPVRSHSPELYDVILLKAEQMLHLAQNKSFRLQVENYIKNEIDKGIPRVEQVAAHFNLSVSTLQRRLREEDINYKELCFAIRKQLAAELLALPQYNVVDVASMLGYTEPSSFYRAFKSWFNQTPQDFRSKSLNQPTSPIIN